MSDAPPIVCPVCRRQFATANDLDNHWRMKRRVSAAHGLDAEGKPRPRAARPQSLATERYQQVWAAKDRLR